MLQLYFFLSKLGPQLDSWFFLYYDFIFNKLLLYSRNITTFGSEIA